MIPPDPGNTTKNSEIHDESTPRVRSGSLTCLPRSWFGCQAAAGQEIGLIRLLRTSSTVAGMSCEAPCLHRGKCVCGFSNSFTSWDLQHVPSESLSGRQDIAPLRCRGRGPQTRNAAFGNPRLAPAEAGPRQSGERGRSPYLRPNPPPNADGIPNCSHGEIALDGFSRLLHDNHSTIELRSQLKSQ